MNPGRLLTLFRVAILAAVFGSMVLVLDYQNPVQPTFCGARSGCAEVQFSKTGIAIAEFLGSLIPGVSLPQLALFAFLLLLGGSFALRPPSAAVGPDGRTYAQPTYIRGRVAVLAFVSVIGGLVAAGLVVLQATIHAFCLYCMIVDTSMMFAAASAIVLWRTTTDEAATKRGLAPASTASMIGVFSGVAAAAIGLPFLWTLYPVVPPLPKEIEALQEPGKITVVSMTDFECPFCRKMAPYLTEAKKNPDVAFKRIMVPLPFHQSARFAARAYLCVPEDQRDEMATKLYQAESMNGQDFIDMAKDLGVDESTFLACADADETSDEIDRQMAIFKAVGGEGLPLTYVGRYAVFGADPRRLTAVLKNAKATPPELPTWMLYVLMGALVVGATVFSWRRCDDSLVAPRA